MADEIKRATGLLVIEAVNSNPNGDPDRESDPRQRPNGLGEISPVSFKRKLRDIVEDRDNALFQELCAKLKLDPENYRILESRGRVRGDIQKEMSDDVSKFDQGKFLNSTFVKKYWDARLFGNTFLESGADKGFIKTGVAQFGMGVSISPVSIVRQTNTNKAGVEADKKQGMAPLAYRIVEHAVYCMPFFINPNYAGKTGCTSADIELLKGLIPYAYDQTKSAIRPDVRIRHAWYIEHKNVLGSCPDYLLFEALTPKRIGDTAEPSVSWKDYEDVTVLPGDLMAKVGSCVDLMAL
ncbi:type I CRISPR-associated protein Cas7 [Brucepastera parasyntrophica]|uniref:type I CRISPR-associated protein Cas7 n=1 Tax=Brucepastera parasyntrophica TaxID=2880008 RepID=UPI0021089971|nr:type I CRISPR-associated protein Cas7 [Brucepastera parasyntrophica]ULQ60109.1 type I CRISPR-associated protein Cas7 [Brucepastera parasyntrophica]